MVKVELWAGLRAFTGGERTVEVDAKNIRELLQALSDAYPGLKPILDEGVSVAIDGEIFADSLIEPVGPENEIVLMQKIRGG
ncbi:MoaD/ThiS family protein [Cognatishimia sp. SS12]|uniref:MoaD/ThiS family protein n=1 Tax=Cognatishimia sp. SS12 TaxID=2979465 RepID=UPI00232E66CB|nr:MoaD/ThiS family protein [Cognatishimia sp. SS12]MDC0739587.1 MoaD/ThiS family protein [Cognatishimia sp. SS12]